MDAKDGIRKILDQLSDDATLEDVRYHIYVRQKIDRGLDDVAQSLVLTEEEFDRRMGQWLEPFNLRQRDLIHSDARLLRQQDP